MKYSIIYADPPWDYKDSNCKGAAKKIYKTMSENDIGKLPINEIADDNSVLFMWATFPKLKEALFVIESWGFTFKTCAFVWVKANKRYNNEAYIFNAGIDDYMGLGRWTRGNAEICLLATKGKPKRINVGVRQIIYEKVARHSQKPNETRKRIVQLIGNLPRIELFSRQKFDGWDCWGNEVESSIELANHCA